MKRRNLAALVAAAVVAGTSACGNSNDDEQTATDPSDSSQSQAASLEVEDPWVKAAASGMTAAFGTLTNSGSHDIVVTAASSEITSSMELHETVENGDGSMGMQPKEGGFSIPAGEEHELSPGGDHLMIMELNRALKPGETITIELVLQDGSTTEIEATVKPFDGADEKYQNGDMDEMEMETP